MFELMRAHQLNIMLLLCGACGVLVLLLAFTDDLEWRRKWILMLMEVVAFCLLMFDRSAYLFAGDTSMTGFVMVRVSNFMVFFLTSAVVFVFNLYLCDYLTNEGNMKKMPNRLNVTGSVSALGMILAIFAAFTNLY